MGRRGKDELPAMRLHRPSGNARVRLNGKDIYLGKYGSEEARVAYHALIQKLVAEQQNPLATIKPSAAVLPGDAVGEHAVVTPAPQAVQEPTERQTRAAAPPAPLIGELLVLYHQHALQKYRTPDGKTSSTIGNVKMAIRALVDFRELPAAEFTVGMFEDMLRRLEARPAIRQTPAGTKVEQGRLLRSTINRAGKYVKQFFKWAAKHNYVPVEVATRLGFAEMLARGRTTAPEGRKVLPVDDEVVQQTLEHLPKMAADMVRIQRLIGCRPGELCKLRPCEIAEVPDDPEVHVWTPEHHKTAWRDHEHRILIGPKAYELLQPYLDRRPQDYCFQPAESEAQRNSERRKKRTSPMTPSHRLRRDRARKRSVSKKPYDEKAYAKAIGRACEKNDIPHWTPNQLRHSVGTEVRLRDGLDSAQVVLGHRRAEVTQRYAEPADERARAYVKQYG